MKQPDLGRNISELRLTKGLTQGELAEKCNLSLRTIQRIESAEVAPRSYTTKMIFSCLDYDFYNSIENNTYQFEKFLYIIKILPWQFFKYASELFNLKKNTMKKLSVISTTAILVCLGLFLSKHVSNAQKIEGWFKAGSKPDNYNVGIDKTIFKTGGSSAFIESTEKKTDGFGTLMQSCSAQEYLGKRIKLTGYIKSVDVAGWAGMWLRVDSKLTRESLSFDNMQDRPVKGDNDWTKCEIILDVPEESGTLNFGILLSGTGKVWFDNLTFKIVDKLNSKTTSSNQHLNKPTNIDFEE